MMCCTLLKRWSGENRRSGELAEQGFRRKPTQESRWSGKQQNELRGIGFFQLPNVNCKYACPFVSPKSRKTLFDPLGLRPLPLLRGRAGASIGFRGCVEYGVRSEQLPSCKGGVSRRDGGGQLGKVADKHIANCLPIITGTQIFSENQCPNSEINLILTSRISSSV